MPNLRLVTWVKLERGSVLEGAVGLLRNTWNEFFLNPLNVIEVSEEKGTESFYIWSLLEKTQPGEM